MLLEDSPLGVCSVVVDIIIIIILEDIGAQEAAHLAAAVEVQVTAIDLLSDLSVIGDASVIIVNQY